MARKLYSWQKTAKYYREMGYEVHKAEYTTRGKSHDLAGFVDGIAWGIGHTIYLQACGKDWTPHVDKITGPCRESVIRCLMAGNRVVLIGWRKLRVKVGKAGRRQERWKPRIREFTLADFDATG